jgi:hypothetical protein
VSKRRRRDPEPARAARKQGDARAAGSRRDPPAADGQREPRETPAARGLRSRPILRDLLILAAAFGAGVGVAELLGAANLGVAFGVGQVVFVIVLAVLLTRD